MIKLVITFRYIVRFAAMFAAICLLSGCLGGTIAQQIARSIATSVADKTMARAMDVDENEDYSESQYASALNKSTQNSAMQRSALQGTTVQNVALQNSTLQNAAKQKTQAQNTEPNDYWYALATSGFEPVKPITEPLPENVEEVETHIAIIEGNQLVRVELFNLLIGDEKNAVYEKARIMGATSLPQKREWQNWGVGTGAIKSNTEKEKKVITFLIPPELGKLPSGAVAVVELANPGELNMARYKGN
jgi:hypothetical protein